MSNIVLIIIYSVIILGFIILKIIYSGKVAEAIYQDGILFVKYYFGNFKCYQDKGTMGIYWLSLPNRKECSSKKNRKLGKIHSYIIRYGNPYPTSHIKLPE